MNRPSESKLLPLNCHPAGRKSDLLRLLVLIAVLTVCTLAWSNPEGEPAVRLEPATIQADAGTPIEVDVVIQNVSNLGAFQFDLTYDPAIVQVDSIALGEFPGSTGRNVSPLGPRTDAGKAVYGAFSFGDAAGPDGSGPLATVTLRAQAPGQTPLGLQNVQAIDVGGSHIPVLTGGGTVTVTGSPAPTPQAPRELSAEPTRAGTATAATVLTPPRASEPSQKIATPFPRREWMITGAVLILIVGLVVLAARQMAR